MIFGRKAKGLHGKMLERQQQLAAIGQQEFHVFSGEVDCDIRVLDFRMRILRSPQLVGKRQPGASEQRVQKVI